METVLPIRTEAGAQSVGAGAPMKPHALCKLRGSHSASEDIPDILCDSPGTLAPSTKIRPDASVAVSIRELGHSANASTLAAAIKHPCIATAGPDWVVYPMRPAAWQERKGEVTC